VRHEPKAAGAHLDRGRGAGLGGRWPGLARLALSMAVAVVALLAAGRLLARPPERTTAAVVVDGTASRGRPAPRVELPDLQGRPVRLADFRGRPVVLNFWASWCPACVAEMPAFEQVHRRLGDRVVFLGVNQRDQRAAAVDLARRSGASYRLAVDAAGRSFDAFGGVGMPTTVLVRADGTVAEIVPGQLDEALLTERIHRDLGIP
jgi:cytochrome c biogenesis protein CcmG, thiol:disulfide interchange protein DsbE